MQKFVFIFRRGSRELTEEEQAKRTNEVRTWVAQQQKDGRNLDPRILADDSEQVGDGAPVANGYGKLIAFNFIEAENFDEAVKIAKTHPGLHYGVSIEVRPWLDPRAR